MLSRGIFGALQAVLYPVICKLLYIDLLICWYVWVFFVFFCLFFVLLNAMNDAWSGSLHYIYSSMPTFHFYLNSQQGEVIARNCTFKKVIYYTLAARKNTPLLFFSRS